MYKFALTIFFTSTLLLLVSCKKQFTDDYSLGAVVNVKYQRDSYERAVRLIKEQDFEQSYKIFIGIVKDLPFSNVSRKALLMAAFSEYSAGKYQNSATIGEQYIDQYSESQDIDYVYYLVGMSYLNLIRDVYYDQRPTYLMLEYMGQIVSKYKNSPYFNGAKFYVSVGRNQLAAKEMEIGIYYMKQEEYESAVLRFQSLISNYSDTEQVEEAMVRLIEAYYSLDLIDEARDMFGAMQKCYPQGYWSKYAGKLVQSKNTN
ncbi:outer membrane protein assembly factor BamD [Candidatus Liberibacter brunswickensis]|uniref:outer membrane protein assembly factor BamD n=1 Tax=Candidatus Liberibacter brunswickensis TaxID=1968796 RepID=UPI002FE41D17